MPSTKYGRSPWLDQFPRSRVPSYPRFRGVESPDVVIIGGGLTGCATAYALAAAGARPVVFEADRIGRAGSARSSGWISDDPGASFVEIEKLHGLRAARSAWQAWRRAALDFVTLLRRLDIKCYVEPRQGALVSVHTDEAVRLKREQKARRAAGLQTPVLNPRAVKAELGVGVSGGLRLKDGATLDPYRACLGLAAAASDRGARFFEQTGARRITFDRKTATVATAGGSVRTRHVVIATGEPNALARSLRRHVDFRTAYSALTDSLPAKIRKELGAAKSILRDSAAPPHLVRWVGDDRLLITGADQDTPPERLRVRVAVQRTGQLMYELSLLYPEISGILPQYGWDAPYVRAADGLPYIGPHRNFPHHLFAFGDGSHSVTGSYLASRILLRHVKGEADRDDDVFGFNR